MNWVKGCLDAIQVRHEGQSVSVVGHSLGGLMAVELGRLCPGLVRGITTLGAPHNPDAFARVLKSLPLGYWKGMPGSDALPATMPVISIYSDGDSLFRPEDCYMKGAHNILVRSPTHQGLPCDRATQRLVLDSLRPC